MNHITIQPEALILAPFPISLCWAKINSPFAKGVPQAGDVHSRGTESNHGHEKEHLKEKEEGDNTALIKEVKRLHLEEGKSQNAIAKELGLSPSTVNKYVHKAI